MMDDRKYLAIELLADGELTKKDIATKIGVSRQTLYDWLENKEFRAELDRRLHGRKVSVQKMIDGKLEFVIDKLYELASDNSNKRVQASVLTYLADRSLGRPTSKHEITADMNKETVNEDVLEQELAELEDGEE
ncbi:phBC6A51 family helix-turn-helix protein [Gracilibacillus caseinilyticus]|uniref:PhBC6A51 family helix-turn-helix protein n=1 Tax=Gracilibacillus caseinilyticus TaxID=2932256 RepID=A0ABY4ETK7_9BACI|nr:phBC6A51 family helix-turn-helix protein [Gracilibacillus caseinilyticus]UOQ47751.1 phBC6A51 family helix-turn-helix protein [Gracilibacillus caseinilyticus]